MSKLDPRNWKVPQLPIWGWVAVGAVALGGIIALAMSQPSYGTWRYGACKVFLENYVRFPESIDIKEGGDGMNSAIIAFSDINPYGSQQIRVFECHYSQDKQGRIMLSKITMDRKILSDEVIKRFNEMLQTMPIEEVDTKLPENLPQDLEDLKEGE